MKAIGTLDPGGLEDKTKMSSSHRYGVEIRYVQKIFWENVSFLGQ